MASKSKAAVKKTIIDSVNWKLLGHERVRPLWQVGAMSLGIAPTVEAVRVAKQDSVFSSEYSERRSFLGRKTHKEPLKDHVLFFPEHHYNVAQKTTFNRMVDVVTCIDVLEAAYGNQLPESFTGLRASLSAVTLPGFESPRGVMAVGAADTPKKTKTNNGARTLAIETQNLYRLIHAMAAGGYKYSSTLTAAEKAEVLSAIHGDAKEAKVAGYGLSVAKIGQILVAAAGLATDSR